MFKTTLTPQLAQAVEDYGKRLGGAFPIIRVRVDHSAEVAKVSALSVSRLNSKTPDG